MVYLGLNFKSQKQDIRNHAAETRINLSLLPSTENFSVGTTKTFDVMANFTYGSASEKLTYLKTSISFSNDFLQIPSGMYIDTSASGFGKIIRVDGPVAANNTGIINIELGATSTGSGPGTSKPLRIARIYFAGKAITPDIQFIRLTRAQIVNSQNIELPVELGSASYNVLASGTGITSGSGTVPAYTNTSNATSSYNTSTADKTDNHLPGYEEPATPTISFPDYISPAPAKPLSFFTSIFTLIRKIFCSIFRVCK